jgi:CheY-like chemotaxis protein
MVLLDFMLPDGFGLDLLRQIRERRPDLPAVLITGYALSPPLLAAQAAEAVRVLPKPFDDDELLTAVSEALTSSSKEVSS